MYVIVGSITTATRLKKAVERNVGFPAYVVHTPSEIRNGGCSYSLRLDNRMLGDIEIIARDNDIAIKGIYIDKIVDGERVYHAIS